MKASAFARRAIKQTYRTTFTADGGDVVADVDSWCFRTERDTARERAKYAPVEPARYTAEELERIRRAYKEEAVGGAGIVVTATNAKDPVIEPDWIEPGTHIAALGADKGVVMVKDLKITEK